RAARTALAVGAVLTAQALALFAYEVSTARSHDLPRPLAQVLGWTARLLGVDSVVAGHDVALQTMRVVHRLGATWELFLDPVTVAFVAGGAVLVVLVALASAQPGRE